MQFPGQEVRRLKTQDHLDSVVLAFLFDSVFISTDPEKHLKEEKISFSVSAGFLSDYTNFFTMSNITFPELLI